MKRKLFIALLLVTALAGGVSYQVFHSMKDVTFKLGNIIFIYKIQTIREKLGFQLRRVQEELVVKDTPYKTVDPDSIISDVGEMEQTMHSCFGCHHEEQTMVLLQMLQAGIEEFKSALSRVFTIRANQARYHEAVEQAYGLGDHLLERIDVMLSAASAKVEKRSNAAMVEVMNTTRIVALSMLFLPICMLLAGLYFIRSITKPIAILMEATRKLGQEGALDYRVTGLKDEFGKLGDSFNVMAESLANQMQVAQRAEQMTVVGQMAAGLAHEIKNPLAGIKVSMEVIRGESYIHDQDRQALTMVIAVINRVNSLINDLLNFARPSVPSLQSIPINSLLEQTANSSCYALRPHAAKDGEQPSFICRTVLAVDLPNVMADPGQVQQIMLNLILNAFDAMPQGGTVTLSSAMVPGKRFVAVTITDTGPGISATLREKIFIPFFSTKKKGTGLGLAICKTLAQTNGGDITINDNIEGGGASFSFFLPIADEQGAT